MLLSALIFLSIIGQFEGDSAKIGVFISTLSKSQVIFGYQLANILSSDNHEVIIIRTHLDPYIHSFKPGPFREIQVDSLAGNHEVFVNFSRVEHEIIFGETALLSKHTFKLAVAFRELITTACQETVSNKDFLNELKAENFDFFYVNHQQNCPMAIAHSLRVRYARFSSANIGAATARPFGIPLIASIVPAWLSGYTDQMSWIERAHNLFITCIETTEDFGVSIFDSIYKKQFGSDFISARQLAQNAELAFINDEELFNYPRPTSHKIVYIGGIGEVSKPPNELSQEYSNFIGDKPTVLVSLGSVANSTEMPIHWKNEFKKLFYSNPNIQFIWKYDGKDVETPKNVLINSWVPQSDLLKSGKISLFLTHGGYNSLSDSLYSGTPMLLIPLFADQFRNSNLAKTRGVGLVIQKSEIHAEFIGQQIDKILSNSSYNKMAHKYQLLLQNKPFKAHELIVRWNRFLIENEPVNLNIRTLNFVQYYCLDIIIPFVIITLTLVYWILSRIARLYYWSCFGMGKKSAHLKRE